jgi:antitoxin (DNA-binding transcriptional repressor) of toxin-antitoxin stability system
MTEEGIKSVEQGDNSGEQRGTTEHPTRPKSSSRPVCDADGAKGEPFVIAKAGKPLVKVTALDTPSAGQVRRLGFMTGHIAVPDDFDRMGGTEIEELFRGG